MLLVGFKPNLMVVEETYMFFIILSSFHICKDILTILTLRNLKAFDVILEQYPLLIF